MEDLAQLFRLMKMVRSPIIIMILDQTQSGRLSHIPRKKSIIADFLPK
tara:strand:- start:217 stop:360 length:144 start_codon:yes stop_codon:yes gene_type:complete